MRWNKVRRTEYARLTGKERRFIKGQKYTLLSHRENLSMDGASTEDPAGGEQTAQYRLPAQGVSRSALELPESRLGATFLRELARQPQVAAIEVV